MNSFSLYVDPSYREIVIKEKIGKKINKITIPISVESELKLIDKSFGTENMDDVIFVKDWMEKSLYELDYSLPTTELIYLFWLIDIEKYPIEKRTSLTNLANGISESINKLAEKNIYICKYDCNFLFKKVLGKIKTALGELDKEVQ